MRNKITENVENGILENNYFFIDTSVSKGPLPINFPFSLIVSLVFASL